MNPRRWVRSSAWYWCAVAIASLAAPAGAQFAPGNVSSPELGADPIARSTRLLGMGRLTLMPDRDNRITLWDFAGNLVGLYDADSTSTLTLRPSTQASSSSLDVEGEFGKFELQEAASRDSRVHLEAIRRPGEGTSYGILAELSQLRSDAIFSTNSERRSQLNLPLAIPVVTGRLPWINPERIRYALFGVFGLNDTRDEYRQLIENGVGRWVDHSGTLMTPPNYFEPNEYFVRRVGGGADVSYEFSRDLRLAIGGNIVSNGITGTNEGERYASEVRERRPVFSTQATLIGSLGSSVEWGADGQTWATGNNQSTWVFTISPSGGPGPTRPPLTGRGDLAKRKEEGNLLRVRAKLGSGDYGVAGSFGASNRKVRIVPSPLSSPNSFNSFRRVAYSQISAADTLRFPEDVLSSLVEDKDWEGVGGVFARLRGGKGNAGAEFHYVKRNRTAHIGQGAVAEELNGAPQIETETQGVLWDARSGIEYRCTEVMTGRGGYIYRTQDQDELTAGNEFLSNTVTAGLTLRPPGSTWTVDAGYAFEWGEADFGSPGEPRLTRQQFGLQIHWGF